MTIDKEQIAQLLFEKHDSFSKFVLSLSPEQLVTSTNGKWNPGQLMDHIIKSVSPVNLAFSLPLFVLGLIFGKANRPSRGYDELVAKYQGKLQAGGKAPKRFWPNASTDIARQTQILLQHLVSLNARVKKMSEAELDVYILPHPLLGKITLREMLYFTIYHVQHHHQQASPNIHAK